jgi:glucokinase
MDDEVVVAIDVGGTTMRGALAREDGGLVETEERPTPADRGPEAVLEALLGLAGDLAGAAEPLRLRCRAAGVAVPGIVDEQAGVALSAVNLGWRELPVARLVSERLSLPVALAHDVRAAGQAEQLYGAARGHRDWVFIALGTGIAAAVVVRGEPYGGARWWGGEMGHTQVDPSGPPCVCGGQGHLEAIASAGALIRLYHERVGETISAEEISRRAASSDPTAAGLWRDAVAALARAIATYVALLDPELVVIGGGLARAGELLLEPLRRQVSAQLAFRESPPIARGELGADAAVVGAAMRGHALARAAGAQ